MAIHDPDQHLQLAPLGQAHMAARLLAVPERQQGRNSPNAESLRQVRTPIAVYFEHHDLAGVRLGRPAPKAPDSGYLLCDRRSLTPSGAKHEVHGRVRRVQLALRALDRVEC